MSEHAAVIAPHVAETSVSVLMKRGRLDAGAYDLEALRIHAAIEEVDHVALGAAVEISSISYPGRFRRTYVGRGVGEPFLLPSQINDLVVRPTKWVVGLSESRRAELSVEPGDLLVTRSGTVGRIALANAQHASSVMSDDLIRIVCAAGWREYLYAFLASPYGQSLMRANEYGAVIQHIEPEHLESLPIPLAPRHVMDKIITEVVASEREKAAAVQRHTHASAMLLDGLRLPDFAEWSAAQAGNCRRPSITTVPYSELHARFDASFHSRDVAALEAQLVAAGARLVPVRDRDVSTGVVLPLRFKRTYARRGNGVPLIGGKDLTALDPRAEKRIIDSSLSERVREHLYVHAGQVLITRSGTVGKTVLCPSHWSGWAVSEHVIRILPTTPEIGAYVAAWLGTEYGRLQIERQIYGSVVDEVDAFQIGEINVPFLDDATTSAIAQEMIASSEAATRAFRHHEKAQSVLEAFLASSGIGLPA